MINGPHDRRINIVFLAEGYTSMEMSKFGVDVQRALTGLFNTPPYREYESYFNVYAIEVPSNESGTDHPYTAVDCPAGLDTLVTDTYFNSSLDVAGIHRLLVPESGPVYAVLAANTPFWDIAFVVVNISYYGGAGGTFATFSTHGASAEIAIHELGHSFAELADEYESGGGGGYEAPNATAETFRDSIKWNDWIAPTTPIPTPETSTWDDVVGLFEGAVYMPTGWYRPRLNCKMRSLGIPFCEVCGEQTVRSVYNLLNTIEWSEPPDTGLYLTNHQTVDLVIASMKPVPNSISIQWFVDGVPAASAVDTFVFDGAQYDSGQHVVEVQVADTTARVHTDPDGLLFATRSWRVYTEIIDYTIGDANEDDVINASDIIYLVNYAFKSGPPPQPVIESGDVTCDGIVTASDIIALVTYIFKSGPEPVCP
jgi:hypothetical protein